MDFGILGALPQRIFGVMTNEVLLAIPLFIFMGVMLERVGIAEDLLETHGPAVRPVARRPRHLGRCIVGTLLAAAKGVVGATTVTHRPDHAADHAAPRLRQAARRRHGGRDRDAGADLPPATVLVLLGDQLSNSYQAAQLAKGILAPTSCR